MIKRIVLFLLAALLLCPMALAEEDLAFNGTITFESGMDEVAAWLGQGAVTNRESMGDYGALGMVGSDNVTCAGHPGCRIVAMFYDDAMLLITAYFPKDVVSGGTEDLVGAISEWFGEPIYPDPDARTLEDYLSSLGGEAQSVRNLCSWKTDEDTDIALYVLTEDAADAGALGGYGATLSIANAEVEGRFNTALTGYLDTED